MANKARSRYSRVGRTAGQDFLNGLVVIVPLAATALIIKWLFFSIDNLLEPLVKVIFGHHVAGVGFVATVILIYVAGVITTSLVGGFIVDFLESLVGRVPLAKEIHGATKQMLGSLVLPDKGSFKEVVLVEFPGPGMKTIGFVTNRLTTSAGDPLVCVFILTAPNPASGFVEMFSPDKITVTGMSVQEAMKMVITGGMVSPSAIRTRPEPMQQTTL